MALHTELAIEESKIRGQRVAAGVVRQRRAGRYVGGRPPFGFRKDEALGLALDDVAAPAAHDTVKAFLDGASLRELCEHLNDSGHPTTYGNPWKPSSLGKWLRNETIAGIQDGEPTWPALVPVVDFGAVRRELDRRSSRTTKGRKVGKKRPVALLAGLARCGTCDGLMAIDRSRKHPGYRCNERIGGPCHHPAFANAADLEGLVVLRALRRLAALEPDDPAVIGIARHWAASSAAPNEAHEQEHLEEELAVTSQRMDSLSQLFARGTIDVDQLETMVGPVAAQQRRVQQKLTSLPEPTVDITALLGLAAVGDDPEAGPLEGPWSDLDLEGRRRALGALIQAIAVRPKEKRGPLHEPQVSVIWA